MSRKRIYNKTTDYWVYGHITPNGLIYIGMSKTQPCFRWHPTHYRTMSLTPYIEQYGWDNIKHIIFKDCLTKEQAETLEDLLILQAMKDNWCINKQRSGGQYKEGNKEYCRQYYEGHKDEKKVYNKQYREEHKEELKEYMKKYDNARKDEKKIYNKQHNKQRNSTPEGKIYYRVQSYNRNHTPIETPAEAKQKYIQWGYIPDYIKNNDLI